MAESVIAWATFRRQTLPQFEEEGESNQEGEWHRQWEAFFYEYYNQLTSSEMFEFRQIRAITETTLQTRNRETKKILEDNSALIDAIPDLNALRIHLEVWINKYDGLFVNTPEMCVLYVGAVDGVPFPRGIEQAIQARLAAQRAPMPASPPVSLWKPNPARPKFGDPIPQPTMDARDLRNLIVEHFDKEGLAELCAEVQADLEVRAINLQVNPDMVGGSSKTNIVLNLINYLEHRGYRGCLEVAVRRLRPNAFQ